MNRQDEINKAAGQVLRDRMQENYFKIFAYYSDHKEEILSDLTQQISCMINQAKIQQETQGKQPIQYVAANFLLSSAITGSFDFKISLMDSLSFLDPIECCIYWSPKWIFAPAEDDKTNLWNQLRKEYVRLRPFELDTIWRIYIYAFYYSITGMFFAENLKTAAINGGLAQLDLIQETQFIFGGLMDRFAVIDTWERGCIKVKYFLLKTDPQFDTAPEIIDWFKRIDRRNICLGKSHNIEKRQLFFIKENSHTVFPDVLSFPFFMVTEALRDVIRMYEPKTIFKEIVLLGHKYAETCTYYLPILEYVDCLDPASKLTRDRSTILEGIISRRKVDDRSIFYLAEVRNLYTVARLDIVESFLRRGAKGLSLNEVKTVHEER